MGDTILEILNSQQRGNGLVYHYCSLSALVGILQTQELRMSSLYWMDDPGEMFWLAKIIRKEIQTLPHLDRHVKEFVQFLEQDDLPNIYCCSFSRHSDLLSQWFRYADEGYGFSIGFDRNLFDLGPHACGGNTAFWTDMDYSKSQQTAQAQRFVVALKNSDGGAISEMLRRMYLTLATAYKNPLFREERETRLVYRGVPTSGFDFFYRRGRDLVPYIKFPFPKEAIRQIRFGPRNKNRRNRDGVRALLQKHLYEVDQIRLTASRIPHR
ncbi:DUF2971 domain-containing protein [Planctomicrobium piriforme]|uniref:DUF2971 domain-containing protein n=1 Tax=Planctomicrobium piriforme TaxID=1576369 RepID=A0A1I3B2I2_9PLAN|nr:DUF2971 domain-containing protein [Planctomicrobium piriforme]SFH55901.1 Protein of unknown function [Planctomicrobium piriforme]